MAPWTGPALLDHLAPLLDERAGVLAGLVRLAFPPGFGEQMHGFSACVARTTELHPLPTAMSRELGSLVGYGTGLDEDTARIRAVCEGIERYCAVMYPTAGLRVATARSLGDEALDPRRLPQCSAKERARAKPAHRLRLPDIDREDVWVRGYSITQGRPRWVPLTAAYLGLPVPPTEHLTFPISTGFAVGTDYDSAVLSALTEVIERDSLALFWLHQLEVPRIVVDENIDPRLATLLSRARAAGLTSHLLDLTSDLGVPVIGVVQICERTTPHVVVMGASRTEGIEAAVRVLEEAGSLRIALSGTRPAPERASFFTAEAKDPEDFGLLYSGRDAIARFRFATESPRVVHQLPPSIEGDALAEILRRLESRGMEVIAVDVTRPEVAEVGLCAVKVIVPELQPITFSHQARYLAHPRLYDAPERMGYGARTESTITEDPIPYA